MIAERPANALFQILTQQDWLSIRPHLKRIALKLGHCAANLDENVQWVLFPDTGLISSVSVLRTGVALETSIVGRQGSLGLVEALGSGRMRNRAVVQVPGAGHQMGSRELLDLSNASTTFRRAVYRLIEFQQAEARQSIICHSSHRIEERFCRWLLECEDLSGVQGTLPLTQAYLSLALGVQRTTVSTAASEAQARKLIRYARGQIELLDREELERSACECRATLQALRRECAPETFG